VSVLVWLLPIVVVTILAGLLTAWLARPRKPLSTKDSMEAHRRFVDALARTRDNGRS
jgi:cytochrome c-type biogenesis protein CcmH/NrfF